MKKSAPATPSDALSWYEKLVATNPSVERKGASMPYTSVNGHMFSFLSNTGQLALRLPADERPAFLKKYKTTLCEQHGRIMEEYVVVPEALLKKTPELKKFFDLSLTYVGALKPKPSAKKKAAPKTAPPTKKAARMSPKK